jgi:superfamily II DNA or RNA helicase
MDLRIHIESSSLATICKDTRALVNDLLAFPASRWVVGPFKNKIKKGYVRRIIATITVDNQKIYCIPTGLVPCVIAFLETKGHKPIVTDDSPKRGKLVKPELRGITFRDDQITTLRRALTHHNGVIIEPTGTGKTVLAAGILSSYQVGKGGPKALFLAHTKDLVQQARDEFKRFGFKVGVWQGTNKTNGDVIVATRQTTVKMDPELLKQFGLVIVDETHHLSEFKGDYFDILYNCTSTVSRFGFTATKPTTVEAKWTLEGAIGPIISEKTILEGNELGILAKPQIKLVSFQGDEYSGIEKDYSAIYKSYIVKNKLRNKIVVDIAEQEAKEGRSSLIFISKLEHGSRIEQMLAKRGVGCVFVHGASDTTKRMETKTKIQTKKHLVVICSVIWKEGVSIKSLNNVIMAAGGKDQKGVLQSIGRGTRLDEGKTEVNIWDFLDPYKFLAEHTIGRIKFYKEAGWDTEIVALS